MRGLAEAVSQRCRLSLYPPPTGPLHAPCTEINSSPNILIPRWIRLASHPGMHTGL